MAQRTRAKTVMVSAVLLAAVATIAPTRAAAEDTELRAHLVFRVDPGLPGCWDEAEFRRRISHRVGFDPFEDDAPTSVHVNVSGSSTAVGGRVEWKDAKTGGMGERRFVAKDGNCGRLLAEMSFAVALQIEMLRPAPKPEPVRTAPVPPATDTGTQTQSSASATSDKSTQPNIPTTQEQPVPPAPSRPAPTDKVEDSSRHGSSEVDAPARWAFSAGFGASAMWGLSPSTTADFRLFVAARRNDLSLEIGGEASYPSDEVRWHGFGFRSRWTGGSVALCGHASAFSACALGRLGELHIEGLGVDRPESPSSMVAHTGLRLGGAVELGKGWFLAPRLEGLLLLTPHTVQMNDVEIWRMPRVSGILGLDLGLRFR
jgi:hypothetical protein